MDILRIIFLGFSHLSKLIRRKRKIFFLKNKKRNGSKTASVPNKKQNSTCQMKRNSFPSNYLFPSTKAKIFLYFFYCTYNNREKKTKKKKIHDLIQILKSIGLNRSEYLKN